MIAGSEEKSLEGLPSRSESTNDKVTPMDPVIDLLRLTLPEEVLDLIQHHLNRFVTGDYASILSCDDAKHLFLEPFSQSVAPSQTATWTERVSHRLDQTLSRTSRPDLAVSYFCVGYAALLLFMQANVTGPPLSCDPLIFLFPERTIADPTKQRLERQALLESLSRDGIAAYTLAGNVELFCVSQAIMTNPAILRSSLSALWTKARIDFMHQRLLTERSSTLETTITHEFAEITEQLTHFDASTTQNIKVCLLLEQAVVQIHHGDDALARRTLEEARAARGLLYELTGRLGRRTKYQQHDISQLVVLAKSADSSAANQGHPAPLAVYQSNFGQGSSLSQPENLQLNDDTLLESIAFSNANQHNGADEVHNKLPLALQALDPANQPQLDPLDSTILLSFASSITNDSPEYGLTREETLPYATRVLEGGSSNWQVYTQALLVRSRVEGFKARTVERGLLQLQALVDQIIAETGAEAVQAQGKSEGDSASTFLPRASASESASVVERLLYVFQLASPIRWELEAELAARWVQLGGLRTALDIYDRLHMWAEAALCLAATEQEEKARNVVRRQLFHSSSSEDFPNDVFDGPARDPPPADAPRLYCILGDIDQSIVWYDKAWTVSKQRYARAQRSIGRIRFTQGEYEKAVEAYTQAVKVNQLNQQTWFALGCAQIELNHFSEAVEAFSRCVQLDDTDAESWSNLAAALLKVDTSSADAKEEPSDTLFDEEADLSLTTGTAVTRRQRNLTNALKAFQRAATIKHDSYRIWHNILVTAASVSPPDYASVLNAQKRIIDLRGNVEGEGCIDVEILGRLISMVISESDTYDPSRPGLVRMTVRFVEESVIPLITSSAELWRLVSRLAIWRRKPATALDAEEKAWRAATARPGWEGDNENLWRDVVESTLRLCEAYQSLGPQEKNEGLASDTGQLVASDWRFKARSALKAIMNKARDSWENSDGWHRLEQAQQSLKN